LLTDPRSFQGQRHSKRNLFAICLCASLCGAEGYESITDWTKNLSQPMRKRLFCKKRIGKHIVPSRSTIYRFLIAIDPEELNKVLGMWIASFLPVRCTQTGAHDDDGIAIDGKTMRGTSKEKGEQTHVLSAVTHEKGIQLTQKKLTPKQMRSNTFVPC